MRGAVRILLQPERVVLYQLRDRRHPTAERRVAEIVEARAVVLGEQANSPVAGQSRIVTPVGKRWDDLFSKGPRASADFLRERPRDGVDEREPL